MIFPGQDRPITLNGEAVYLVMLPILLMDQTMDFFGCHERYFFNKIFFKHYYCKALLGKNLAPHAHVTENIISSLIFNVLPGMYCNSL